MSTKIYTIAIDCMGADLGPKAIVQGVNIAAEKIKDINFILFGDENEISPVVLKYESMKNRYKIVNTSCYITNDTPVQHALSGKMQDSSMRMSLESVRDGLSDGVISAGNTGAYLALARGILGTINGIRRPAIISRIPTQKGQSVMLDLGANISCTPEMLVQFGKMGSLFAKYVTKKNNPSVGLLNVGSENQKGNDTLISAREMLEQININFIGFLEGDDIYFGKADVYVTDGYAGNISLKTAEGMIKFMMSKIKQEVDKSIIAKIGAIFMKSAFKRIKSVLDPKLYNGAFWIGLKGVAVKSHGSADALAFFYAIDTTSNIIRSNLNEHIAKDMEDMNAEIK